MSKYRAIPNSGFKENEKDERDLIFGGLTSLVDRFPDANEILAPNGQWDDYRIDFEGQRNNVFDPWACTNFAFTNALEFINKQRYGDEKNRSDRFSALTSGTIPGQGNSIKNPSEACRTKGTVSQESMPYPLNMTEAQFYNKNDLTPNLLAEGLEWLKDYEFGYEKLHELGKVMDKEKAMEALKYSPLQTAIDSSTKITSQFRGWNDSVVIYGYEEGKYWKVFGSYLQTTGDFPWDYPFYVPNKFHLKKKVEIKEVITNNMQKFYKKKDDPKIYQLGADGLFHWITEEPVFRGLYGNFEDNKIEEIEIPDDKIGFAVYIKQTIVDLISNLLKGKI